MIEPIIKYIKEPLLTFGNGQKAIDPRDGLMLFGPYDQMKIKGQRNIGVIGTKSLRYKMIEYLKKLHSPIVNSDRVIARPNFPGLETVFGIYLNFENIPQIDIKEDDINKFLKYTDPFQRVHNLVNLYVDKLNKYSDKEEVPVDVWVVIIPEDIYKYGRPNSKIPKDDDNVLIGLKPKERNSKQIDLFFQEENEILNEAYQYEVNFHNQLKAKILNSKIVTQIIRESKIVYQDILTERMIEIERKFDSAKAWNISTTLYYKFGGLPWKLGEIRAGICYLGLVYKKIDSDTN